MCLYVCIPPKNRKIDKSRIVPWSAPVLLVKKKDDSYRVVVDYTKLNEKTKDDQYPLSISVVPL